MANRVGPKGQVVIEKEIRDKLGVKPGWKTLQAVVGDAVQICFVPPEHNRSLYGAARPFIRRSAPPEEEWDDLVAEAAVEEFIDA